MARKPNQHRIQLTPKMLLDNEPIQTHPDFWDCSCDSHYIQPKTIHVCRWCGCVQDDERPDSMVSEMDDPSCMSAEALAARNGLSPDELRLLRERSGPPPGYILDSKGVPVA